MKHDLLHCRKEGRVATDVAILEAALEQFALTGIRRTSTDDVARRAGVNRATLYRRFGSREQLLAAAYLHEAGRVLEELTRRVPDVPEDADSGADFDPAANVVTMFTEAVALMRSHPLLERMRQIDGDLIAQGMTVGAGDVLGFAADTLAHRIRELHRWRGTEPPADPRDLGHTVARLIHSLVLTPDGGPDLDTPAAARRYAAAVVVPLVLGHVS
ncbi:TetR/AcrR family transcriptional regulator [Nocardioides pocheonensis]|jgi:AcrR family transcriptional regulator|uniref:TetR/AcrR family transcriptional regulator n=1 Tax=Nocardioides pocheonensis TaxID=661485 RepID=A0A3N0GLW7_9ACTN|nr:TetR/AcrR family transcriptional regulator [Nocardioides pocheonensis]